MKHIKAGAYAVLSRLAITGDGKLKVKLRPLPLELIAQKEPKALFKRVEELLSELWYVEEVSDASSCLVSYSIGLPSDFVHGFRLYSGTGKELEYFPATHTAEDLVERLFHISKYEVAKRIVFPVPTDVRTGKDKL